MMWLASVGGAERCMGHGTPCGLLTAFMNAGGVTCGLLSIGIPDGCCELRRASSARDDSWRSEQRELPGVFHLIRFREMANATAVVRASAEPAAPPEPELKSWALVELFGHQRIVGFLSQQTFGTGVALPRRCARSDEGCQAGAQGFTRYFGLSAIYSITPVDEDTVRRMLPSVDGTPGEARPLTLHSFNRREYEDG